MWGTTQNLAPIGSAVLTFIGYKRTDEQTSKVVQGYPQKYDTSETNMVNIALISCIHSFLHF